MSKWTLPNRKKPLPKPKEVIICRVVPPRLAFMDNIADWLYSSGNFTMRKVDKDFVFVLMNRYKELRELGMQEDM